MVRRCDDQLEYEADPRHAERIVKELGLGDATSVSTPMEAHELSVEGDEDPLEATKHKRYRSVTAIAPYLSLDRSDI